MVHGAVSGAESNQVYWLLSIACFKPLYSTSQKDTKRCCVISVFSHIATLTEDTSCQVVLVVQWLGVGLVIERSLVSLLARALSSQLGQLSLESSTSMHGWA